LIAILLSLALGAADIGVKDRANANPSIAASGQFVTIAWTAATKDGATDVFVATSRDGGRLFGAPAAVTTGGGASASGEQPPRVALVPRDGREPAIVVVWTAKGSSGTRLLSARSEDGGKSFAAPANVPGSDAAGNRGWESIATNRDGGVVALWLDHRETATGKSAGAAMDHAEHQHLAANQDKADGVARAQLSKLFFAKLGQPDSAHAIAAGVCYCCKTSIATDAAGGIYAVWRHVYDGNVRDIAFTMSTDGGRTFGAPVRVSTDNWVLDGCPENGPALVVDAGKQIHVAWPTLVPASSPSSEPTMSLFYASSSDGRRFTARLPIPTDGFPRHPQIALGPRGDVIVAWDERTAGNSRVVVARATRDATGHARFARQVIGDNASASYPVIATAGDATIVVWTTDRGVIRIDRR
jgi:hypothetical protein